MKKLLTFVTGLMMCLLLTSTAFAAGNFQKIYDGELGMNDLAQDKAVSETFNTNDGVIKLQIRKLRQEGDQNKYHLLIWLEKTRIYDAYFPTVQGGYTFKAFKNTATNDIFFAIGSRDRAYLGGYSRQMSKYLIYADSLNYYNDFDAVPVFTVLKNGDLVLAFDNENRVTPRYHAYKFKWDADKFWFSYRDEGIINGSLKSASQI